jgi:hypothetical protein
MNRGPACARAWSAYAAGNDARSCATGVAGLTQMNTNPPIMTEVELQSPKRRF